MCFLIYMAIMWYIYLSVAERPNYGKNVPRNNFGRARVMINDSIVPKWFAHHRFNRYELTTEVLRPFLWCLLLMVTAAVFGALFWAASKPLHGFGQTSFRTSLINLIVSLKSFNYSWLVVSTPFEESSSKPNLPQIRVSCEHSLTRCSNIWSHSWKHSPPTIGTIFLTSFCELS